MCLVQHVVHATRTRWNYCQREASEEIFRQAHSHILWQKCTHTIPVARVEYWPAGWILTNLRCFSSKSRTLRSTFLFPTTEGIPIVIFHKSIDTPLYWRRCNALLLPATWLSCQLTFFRLSTTHQFFVEESHRNINNSPPKMSP